jgi:hypothetical protein
MKTRQKAKTGAVLVLFVLAVATCGRLHADEDRAVKAIQKLGGKIIRDETAPNKPIVSVDLMSTDVTDVAPNEGMRTGGDVASRFVYVY